MAADGLRFLVIEDSDGDYFLLERYLRQHLSPAECRRATNAPQLSAALSEGGWDIVLSDYRLPGLAFERVIAQVREALADTPVILVSGSVGEERAVELLKLGVWDFVLKDSLLRLASSVERCREEAVARRARQAAEDALRESEARYRLLADHAEDIVCLDDADGQRLYVSPSYHRLTGWAPGDDHAADWRTCVHPDDVAAMAEARAANLRGEASVVEHRLLCADGSWRWMESRCRPVIGAAGQVEQTVVYARDISARKDAEAERLEHERRLLHAQKLESLGVLAGGIAHDFNNLLMAILGNLDMALLDLPGDHAACESIHPALSAARRASDLTRQLLAYSGKGRFVLEDLDLNALVRENGDIFRAAIPRTVTLRQEPAEVLPRITVDAGQVQQIVMNLITNGAEAIGAHAGTITLRTGLEECDAARLSASRLEDKPAPGSFVFVEVADTGCGMDEDTQQRLFDPFYTTKVTGRGLGMAAVQGIVKAHGGAILVASAPSRGTTIRILFPVPATEALPDAAPATCPATSDGAPRTDKPVLVVDDEEAVRAPCMAALRHLGYHVLGAADGQEAVEVVRRRGSSLACVLMDVTMPTLDGIAAAREIRRLAPGLRVILTSGYEQTGALEALGADQSVRFLQKPYRLEDLRVAVGAAVADAAVADSAVADAAVDSVDA